MNFFEREVEAQNMSWESHETFKQKEFFLLVETFSSFPNKRLQFQEFKFFVVNLLSINK
jgi:hypothetical protein